jgi:pimeloyl-ACP methyl ester carboxylesterase
MGHSFGGVLARMAYLISAGQYADVKRHGSAWWQRVDRIVLFAAPNRGIPVKRFRGRERLAVYLPFGRAGQLTRDQLVGSEAITNLRIVWIRFFAGLDQGSKPAVVQFLGKGDRYVSREDSLDIEQFGQATQFDIPGATHGDVHMVPEADARRYEVLRHGILGRVDTQTDDQQRETHRNPVVMVLHGIRAGNESWVEQIRTLVGRRAANALAIGPTYQYFSLLDFAIPWIRSNKLRFFHDQYSELLARHPLARFCFIGHSNGTYLLGHSLRRIPGMAFDRVVLLGSVLPREYDWKSRFDLSQVREVVNHRASRDVPVSIACNLLRSLGMKDVGTAGVFGFDERREEIKEVYYYNGGHSAGLKPDNLETLADCVLSGAISFPLARQDVKPHALLSRLSGSTIVGLAAAGLVAALLVGCVWITFRLLSEVNPWPAVQIAASLVVLATLYLFSRYY